MNEELAQQGAMNLAGVLVLTAIPVVAFALWCDYFERFFKARMEEGEEVDRGEELYRVRTAGFFINLFQVLIFFGSTPVRREHPWVCYPLFFVAFMIQLMTQRSLEGKIGQSSRKKSINSPEDTKPAPDYHWQALRTFFWSLIAGMAYVASILVSVFVFTFIAVLFEAPVAVRISCTLLGMVVGVVGGLCLSFALGSLFVRKIMCARTLPDGELRNQITECFKFAKIQVPALWLVDVPQFHLGSAMMAGFPKGRGLFRPGYFISTDVVEKLTESELRSVTLHEISHWRLQHLKKRFTYSAGLILCASLLTGVAVLCTRFAGVSEQGQSMVGFGSLLISFLFAFRLLAAQVKYQEFAADIHSIERLGSTLPELSSALRKLDRLSNEIPARRDPGSRLMSLGHPATEYRIRILEKYFERKAAQNAQPAVSSPAAQDSSSNDKAA